MTPAIVLLNPLAGAGRARALRQPIQRWLEHHAPAVPLLVQDSVEASLATLTITAMRTRVVLVGGDGTLHALLPALLQRRHRVGLVPAGQTNTLAAALGLTRLNWSRALHYALHAPAEPIDLGRIESDETEGLSLFSASLDCGLATAPRPPAPWRALWQRLRHGLHESLPELNIWADGRPMHSGPARLLSVLNTPLAHQQAHDQATPAEPTLVWHLSCGHPQGRALMPGESAASSLPGDAASQWCHKLLVSAREPVPLMLDGENHPPLQCFTVQLQPRALRVAHCAD